MKKSLIALAALSTIAGSVAAQSSVTVYGRLDAGYLDRETTVTGIKTQSQAISYNSFTSSRLGFSGTEDLGGGLKAGFVVEGNIAAAGGTTGSNNATAFNFGRQQYLTLSSASAGTLLAGKTDSLVKTVFDNFDAGYANNLVGAFDSLNGANIIGNRRDAVARYTLPTISGVTAAVGVIKSTTEVDQQTSKTEDNTGYEAGLTYTAGALSLAAAYRTADVKNPAAAEVAAVAGNAGTAAVAAADGTTNSLALGGSYNFGPVVGFVQYFDQEAKNKLANNKVSESGTAIGVRVPYGKSTFFASMTEGDSKAANNVKTDLDGIQLGVKYDLSKRTYGYVAYGKNETQAEGARKAEAKDLALGLVHSF